MLTLSMFCFSLVTLIVITVIWFLIDENIDDIIETLKGETDDKLINTKDLGQFDKEYLCDLNNRCEWLLENNQTDLKDCKIEVIENYEDFVCYKIEYGNMLIKLSYRSGWYSKNLNMSVSVYTEHGYTEIGYINDSEDRRRSTVHFNYNNGFKKQATDQQKIKMLKKIRAVTDVIVKNHRKIEKERKDKEIKETMEAIDKIVR